MSSRIFSELYLINIFNTSQGQDKHFCNIHIIIGAFISHDIYTVLWLYDELFLKDELLKKLQNRQAEKI